jgi:hypothetical protein
VFLIVPAADSRKPPSHFLKFIPTALKPLSLNNALSASVVELATLRWATEWRDRAAFEAFFVARLLS